MTGYSQLTVGIFGHVRWISSTWEIYDGSLKWMKAALWSIFLSHLNHTMHYICLHLYYPGLDHKQERNYNFWKVTYMCRHVAFFLMQCLPIPKQTNTILKSANLVKAVIYWALATSNMAVGNRDKYLILEAGLGSVSITHKFCNCTGSRVSAAIKPPMPKYFPLGSIPYVFLCSCMFFFVAASFLYFYKASCSE